MTKTMMATGKGTASEISTQGVFPRALIEKIYTRQNYVTAMAEMEESKKSLDQQILAEMQELKIEKISDPRWVVSAVAPGTTRKLSVEKLRQRVAADVIEECYESGLRAGYLQVKAAGEK